MKKPSNERHITHEMSVQLGSYGQGMADGLEELAAEFMRDNELQETESFIAAQLVILEALIFLVMTKTLEPDERIPALRGIMISLRRSLTRYHQEREIDPKTRRDH
jgi:hypothetical protein